MRHPHLQFRKHWSLSENISRLHGEVVAKARMLTSLPLPPERRRRLMQVALIKGAQATTAIEGNTLTFEEIEDVTKGVELPESRQYQAAEAKNVYDAMNDILEDLLTKDQDALVTPQLIRNFHHAIARNLGDHLDAIPGNWRTDERHVGGVYRCPPPAEVPGLVDRLCEWLQQEFSYPDGHNPAKAVIEAIVAHVYLEWIHPFGDGNGRTGRLLEFFVLMRGGFPDLTCHLLSNHYNLTRDEYYRQLQKASQDEDLSSFIAYALQGLSDGIDKQLYNEFMPYQVEAAWRNFVYDVFSSKKTRKISVFKRQRALALAQPLLESFTLEEAGTRTPSLVRSYAQLTDRTLRRDLEEVLCEELGLVEQVDGKYRMTVEKLKSSHLPLARLSSWPAPSR